MMHAVHDGVVRDSRIIRHRLSLAGWTGLLLLAGLFLRIAWMQVVQGPHYEVLAENNLLRPVPVAPRRGLIYDRHGELLATNGAQYGVSITAAQAGAVEETVARLRALVSLHDWEVRRFHRQAREHRHTPVLLRADLSPWELARVSSRLHQLPGVSLATLPVRDYLDTSATSHILGYVRGIDSNDRARIDAARYRATERIGKAGIEHRYESLLLGFPGMRQASVDSYGRILKLQDLHTPQRGASLTLTVDARLQRDAARALEGHMGAIVAIEPATGDVLAMASAPQFDPALFAGRLSPEDFRLLYHNPDRPLLNRALQGRYPPGSTIKPFLAIAGLESGTILPDKRFFAGPEFRLPGVRRPFRDWKEEGHGWVTVSSAIERSCDVYFYSLAHQLGIDAIHEALAAFGLGEVQGIDLAGEDAGLLPSAAWKRETLGEAWYPGETIITGIGQGHILTTPLQLATATATLATRGKRMRPRLLLSWEGSADEGRTQPELLSEITLADPGTWDLVSAAMEDVMHGDSGTARASGAGAAYRIAGKTGTAQVVAFGEERPDEDQVPFRFRDHSLFIAFAPADEPRIAIAVVIEHGGSGSKTAAPIARALLDSYLLGAQS